MTYGFRRAVRENVPLIVALSGPSGGGKTLSALKLARGLAGGDDAKVYVIDTESGRAKHYACGPNEKPGDDRFAFQHGDMRAPFRPEAYTEAVRAAEKAGAVVIVVDSMSHEWAGTGGILDWHEDEMQRMAGDNYQKREAVKMAAWIKPKMSHKQMMSDFLQCRAHLIFCLRAEEKMLMLTDTDPQTGRKSTRIIAAADRPLLERWAPICEKNFMYEMAASFLLLPDKPGVGRPVKLQAQHRPFFSETKPIDESCGRSLAAWANGGAAQTSGSAHPREPTLTQADAPAAPADAASAAGSQQQDSPAPALAVTPADRAHQGAVPKAAGEGGTPVVIAGNGPAPAPTAPLHDVFGPVQIPLTAEGAVRFVDELEKLCLAHGHDSWAENRESARKFAPLDAGAKERLNALRVKYGSKTKGATA